MCTNIVEIFRFHLLLLLLMNSLSVCCGFIVYINSFHFSSCSVFTQSVQFLSFILFSRMLRYYLHQTKHKHTHEIVCMSHIRRNDCWCWGKMKFRVFHLLDSRAPFEVSLFFFLLPIYIQISNNFEAKTKRKKNWKNKNYTMNRCLASIIFSVTKTVLFEHSQYRKPTEWFQMTRIVRRLIKRLINTS